MKSVQKGMLAPDFSLPSDEGENVSLIGLRGKRVVLYFYPRDDTPGCTIQACDFRNAMPRFEGVDAVVLGVSPDSEESHRRFREKFALTFPLLADEDHAVAEALVDGRWQVVDATCLAPRQSMVRIATGRDAADTAWLDNHKGAITVNNMAVTATVDGELPKDSVDQLVMIR